MDEKGRRYARTHARRAIPVDAGTLVLSQGGAVLTIPGAPSLPDPGHLHGEYSSLYRRFAEVIRTGMSDVDMRPLRLVADIFLRARWRTVEPFMW